MNDFEYFQSLIEINDAVLLQMLKTVPGDDEKTIELYKSLHSKWSKKIITELCIASAEHKARRQD